jgi:hypothetical protein
MIETNILGALQQIRLTVYVVDNIIRVHFSEMRLREPPRFQELWEISHPRENLSARRRNAQFRWIKKRDQNNTLRLLFDFTNEKRGCSDSTKAQKVKPQRD